MDSSSNAKTGISLASVLGFSDELQKIAGMPKPTSLGDVRKAVSTEGTALQKRKPAYTKVNKDPVSPASPLSDAAESSKSVQPPPVTMPRGDL